MKISIIIPIYNMEEYIEGCIENIMHQTLSDIEVICIDDGSIDNTIDVIKKLQGKYENLRCFVQEHAGAGKARNKGIMESTGEFVAFMDADDFYYSDDVLEQLYNTAKEKNVFICGGSACNYRDGIITREGLREGNVFKQDGYIKYIDYPVFYGFWRFIYKRDLLLNNEVWFPDYIHCEDPSFFVKAMIVAEKIYAISKDCYCYRKEHKKHVFNTRKIKDYASGMLDILIMSKQHKLSMLHTMIINEIHSEISAMLYREIADDKKELEILITEINANIDEELVYKNKLTCKNLYLLPVDEIRSYVSGVKERKGQFIEELRNCEKVYVYGAGIVGKRVIQFLTSETVGIEAVLVTNKKQNPDYVGNVSVREIDSVKITEKDVVLIATFPYLHEEIAKGLLDRSVTNIKKIYLDEFIMYENELEH